MCRPFALTMPEVTVLSSPKGFLIATDHLGFIFLVIGQLHNDFRSILDHVVVGQNRSIAVDDKSGAKTTLALRATGNRAAEKTSPKIVERIFFTERAAKLLRATPFTHLGGRNIDNDRPNLFRQIHEIRQTALDLSVTVAGVTQEIHRPARR